MTSKARKIVLLVEDDRDTREMYSLFLEMSGFTALTASNLEAAFLLAVERQPDILITDLMLGGPGSGAELCRRVRDDPRTAAIPVIVLTGSTRASDLDAAAGAGCTHVRTKPYLPDALVNDIREMIDPPERERFAV